MKAKTNQNVWPFFVDNMKISLSMSKYDIISKREGFIMKPKLKYAPLAIATAIVNVIALIGTYMIYSPLNSLANASSSGDYASLANFSTDSLTISAIS